MDTKPCWYETTIAKTHVPSDQNNNNTCASCVDVVFLVLVLSHVAQSRHGSSAHSFRMPPCERRPKPKKAAAPRISIPETLMTWHRVDFDKAQNWLSLQCSAKACE